MTTNKRTPNKPTTSFKIKICENGPYAVTGGVPLRINRVVLDAKDVPNHWELSKIYPAQESYSLCRCGKSKNMPFCDGSHLHTDFDGMETASRKLFLNQAKIFKGPDLTLTDLPNLCVHAGFCDRAGGTWNLTQYSDTPEARRIAIEEAADCPSGRLVVWDTDGNLIEPELEPSIDLVEDPYSGLNGPLWVRGGIPIESLDGTIYEIRNRVTLCRCGRSHNKPFCDGMHLER